MKLATLKDHHRDGRLVVVSQKLTMAAEAKHIAPTMQSALDNWSQAEPLLRQLSHDLETGGGNPFPFYPKLCAAPLPRAYQWLDASIFVNHVELVRKSRGQEMPANFTTDPLMYQGASDHFLGPCDDIHLADENLGVDFEAEVAVITDDVPMGATPEECEGLIRLVTLTNDISLRYLAKDELQKGFGFVQAKPSSSFAPVAVTPDELGAAWKDARLHLPILSTLNGVPFGSPNAGVGMTFGFGQLIAHAARTRPLCAGTIMGSGAVSNKGPNGSSCIVEKIILEKMEHGQAKTRFMRYGDTIRIEMRDAAGQDVFGVIDQALKPYTGKAAQT